MKYYGEKEFSEEIIGVYEIPNDRILICTQIKDRNLNPFEGYFYYRNNSNLYLLNLINLQIITKMKFENFLKILKLKSGNFLIIAFDVSYNFHFRGWIDFYFLFIFISSKNLKTIKYKKIPFTYLKMVEEISIYEKNFNELIEMKNGTFLFRYYNTLYEFKEDSFKEITKINHSLEIEEMILLNDNEIILVDRYSINKYSLKSKEIIECFDIHSYSYYIDCKKCFLSKCKKYLIMNAMTFYDSFCYSLFIIDISNMQAIKLIIKDIGEYYCDMPRMTMNYYHFPNDIFLALCSDGILYEFDMFDELINFNYDDKKQIIPIDSEKIISKYEEHIDKKENSGENYIKEKNLSKIYNFIGYNKSGKIFFCDEHSIYIYKF